MKHMYSRVVNLLKCCTARIVLVTVPPIALCKDDPEHWNKLHNFNDFVENLANKYDVHFVDFAKKLIHGRNNVKIEY